jgi:hypothetical protein
VASVQSTEKKKETNMKNSSYHPSKTGPGRLPTCWLEEGLYFCGKSKDQNTPRFSPGSKLARKAKEGTIEKATLK